MSWKPRYFDIGVNITDNSFKNPQQVLNRSLLFHVKNSLITSSTLNDTKKHLQYCDGKHFFTTVGVHPCSAGSEYYVEKLNYTDSEPHFTDDLVEDVDSRFEQLAQVAIKGYAEGKIKAFGELGLDYDRLFFSSKVQQKYVFEKQLELFSSLNIDLPYFLHMRAACDDFIKIIKPYTEKGLRGVIHSFTGSEDDLNRLLSMGFHVSVNGCSLRTEENIAVAAKIPIDKLMIETDSPYCSIRKNNPAGKKFLTCYPNKFYPQFNHKIHSSLDLLKQESERIQSVPGKKKVVKFQSKLPLAFAKKNALPLYHEIVENLINTHKENVHFDASLFTEMGPLADPCIEDINEPAFVGSIAQLMAGLHGIEDEHEIEKFIETVYLTSCKVFNIDPINIE